jgi:3-hydroxyisobutyrate dehydrogenase-like beta-hydroxyacid dehydrogenase
MGKLTYMGPSGSGQTCKLANQITVAANCAGLAEGLLYAHRSGLDPRAFLRAVSGGAAGSKVMEIFGPQMLAMDFTPGGFAENMVKDLGTAIKEGQAMGSCFPGLASTQQLFLSLVAHGDGRLGCQAALRSLQRLNNLMGASDKP